MDSPEREEQLILRKMGIRVSLSRAREVANTVKNNPDYLKNFEKAKASLDTMTNEDKFLEV